jgi:hypothetical protein
MGKPTISKYGVGAYVDGSDLIINDANILAEIGGNLESRSNITKFNHYFTANYQFRPQSGVANGVYSAVGILNLPSAFKVLRAEFIGYADELAANRQFAGSPVNSNANNKVVGRLRHLDSTTGKALIFEIPGQSPQVNIEHTVTIDTGGTPESLGTFASNGGGAEGPISLTVSPNSLLEVSFKIDQNAHADFYPVISCVVFCVMEHGK